MSDNLRQGIKLYQSRKYTEALSFFLSLPSDSSDNIDLAYFIGLCYTRLNKYDEALLYLEQVVTNGTDEERIKQCRLSLAVIYSLTNRSKMAEFELSRLVDDGINTEQVQCAKGYIAWYRDEIDKSIECYENVLSQNPENSTALNGLGYILACTGKDLTRALFLCKKALDSNPESSAYLDSLGWVYYKLGLLKEAKSFIKRALDKNPENEEIKEHYQEILSSSSDIKNNDISRRGQF